MLLENLKATIQKRTLAEVIELHDKRALVGPMFLSNRDYHLAPGLSKSILDNIWESPAYHQFKLKSPDEMTEALIFGSAWHSLILKDEPLDSIVYITKTQPQKPERDEHGRAPLSEKNLAKAQAMAEVFHAHSLAPKLLQNALIECSFFWTDRETGILCKCKPDLWHVDQLLLTDAKTAANISERPLKRTIKDFRYHVQGAFFIEGVSRSLEQAGLDVPHPSRFALVPQEKSEPWDIAFRQLGPRSLVTGEIEFRKDLETYGECTRTGVWPGKAPAKFVEIELEVYDLKDWSEGGV